MVPPLGGTQGHPARACPCTRDTALPPAGGGVTQWLALSGQPPHADTGVRAAGVGAEHALAHRALITLPIPDSITATLTTYPIPVAALPLPIDPTPTTTLDPLPMHTTPPAAAAAPTRAYGGVAISLEPRTAAQPQPAPATREPGPRASVVHSSCDPTIDGHVCENPSPAGERTLASSRIARADSSSRGPALRRTLGSPQSAGHASCEPSEEARASRAPGPRQFSRHTGTAQHPQPQPQPHTQSQPPPQPQPQTQLQPHPQPQQQPQPQTQSQPQPQPQPQPQAQSQPHPQQQLQPQSQPQPQPQRRPQPQPQLQPQPQSQPQSQRQTQPQPQPQPAAEPAHAERGSGATRRGGKRGDAALRARGAR